MGVATHWALLVSLYKLHWWVLGPNHVIGVRFRERILCTLIYIDVTIGDCRTLTQRMLLVTTLRSQIITWLQSSARHTTITRLLAADIVAQFPQVTPWCAQAGPRWPHCSSPV